MKPGIRKNYCASVLEEAQCMFTCPDECAGEGDLTHRERQNSLQAAEKAFALVHAMDLLHEWFKWRKGIDLSFLFQ